MRFRESITDIDVLKRYAPSVFAEKPSSLVSDKYRFIPTSDIVSGLLKNDFAVTSVVENRVRNKDKAGFQTHLLKFRPKSLAGISVGDVFPEIRVRNSHDGLSSLQIDAGLFRLACLNGLTVADSMLSTKRVRHSGKMIDDAIEASFRVLDDMPKVIDTVKQWQGVELKPEEKRFLADSALLLKYDSDETGKVDAPITGDKLLMPRRYGDQKNDLWTTFNVIQENLIKGGQRAMVRDGLHVRRVSTRAVNSIDTDTKINKALWLLSERMQEFKAA